MAEAVHSTLALIGLWTVRSTSCHPLAFPSTAWPAGSPDRFASLGELFSRSVERSIQRGAHVNWRECWVSYQETKSTLFLFTCSLVSSSYSSYIRIVKFMEVSLCNFWAKLNFEYSTRSWVFRRKWWWAICYRNEFIFISISWQRFNFLNRYLC